MRVFILPFAAMTALLLAACSGGTEGSTLQRSRSASSTRAVQDTTESSGGAPSASATPPSAPAAPPPSDPGPASDTNDAGAATTPVPAPAPAPTSAAPGTCGNPKCLGGNGLAGCKATDGAGDLVTMGCQDGACACFVGDQATTEFDGDVNSADDAAQLFLTNCACN